MTCVILRHRNKIDASQWGEFRIVVYTDSHRVHNF